MYVSTRVRKASSLWERAKGVKASTILPSDSHNRDSDLGTLASVEFAARDSPTRTNGQQERRVELELQVLFVDEVASKMREIERLVGEIDTLKSKANSSSASASLSEAIIQKDMGKDKDAEINDDEGNGHGHLDAGAASTPVQNAHA